MHLAIIIIVASAAIMLLGYALYYPYSPAGRQHQNMAIARQLAPKLQPIFQSDKRFSHVGATEFTGAGGSLLISGYVKSDQDLSDLIQAVNKSSPPVEVSWGVKVYPSPIYEDLEKSNP